MRNTSPYNIFDDISTDDYIQLVKDYNPQYPMREYQELTSNYITPNSNYLYFSTRNLNMNVVSYETLSYIIARCLVCPVAERYKACIVGICKMFIDNRSLYQINKAKNKMIHYLVHTPQKQNTTQRTSTSYCPCCKVELRLSK